MKKEEDLRRYFHEIFKHVELKYTDLEKIENANLFWNRLALNEIRFRNEPKRNLNVNWMDCFNDDQFNLISLSLEAELKNWGIKDTVYFCVSKSIIIKTTWSEFLQHWNLFIEFDDDCPFVLNLEIGSIFFDAFGAISYYNQTQ